MILLEMQVFERMTRVAITGIMPFTLRFLSPTLSKGLVGTWSSLLHC
jgi:hypothetical protein